MSFQSKSRLDNVVFGVSLFMLMALAVWWSAAMDQWVLGEYGFEMRLLGMEARALAEEQTPAQAGPLADQPRFEVVAVPRDPSVAGLVKSNGLWVQPAPSVVRDLEERRQRRLFMVAGEGSMLFILVGVCTLMLYRLVRSERRSRREMERFLSRVTHEMKTPLAGLRALLETVRMGRLPPAELEELAGMGLAQIAREEHLVENLLVAQRLWIVDDALHPKALELDDVLTRFRGHRLESHVGSGEQLIVESAEGQWVRADEDAVWTILDNLVDNAHKYGAGQIALSVREGGGRVEVVCCDDGQGFAPEAAESIFEGWKRGDEQHKGWRQGAGLGLEISRNLARQMKGDLVAQSDGPGQGARFVLSLPQVEGEA